MRELLEKVPVVRVVVIDDAAVFRDVVFANEEDCQKSLARACSLILLNLRDRDFPPIAGVLPTLPKSAGQCVAESLGNEAIQVPLSASNRYASMDSTPESIAE